jgi:hypothetical protein
LTSGPVFAILIPDSTQTPYTGGKKEVIVSNIKFFTDENLIEPQARNQVYNISKLPIIEGKVAIMPDCHFGKGALKCLNL